jgi:4-hydroxybenzoate polyprenyltransferase
LYPVFKMTGFSLQLNEGYYFMFCFAFVCMAAGGYIINDYSDVNIDKINKPGKVIIGKEIAAEQALRLYWVFSIVGIALGIYAAYKIRLPGLGLLFFIYLSGLWFYSTSLKYIFLIGNFVIAVFLALVPFIAGLIELYTDVSNPYFGNSNVNMSFLLYGITGISVFAFLINLAREIVKDMEDVEGDKVAGCRTLPIVLGIKATKNVVWFIMILVISLSAYVEYKAFDVNDWYTLVYIAGFIDVPVLVSLTKLKSANTPAEFHKVSGMIKWLMVLGICYLFVFTFICLHSV